MPRPPNGLRLVSALWDRGASPKGDLGRWAGRGLCLEAEITRSQKNP
jgi:hypothetical protein